MDVALKRQKTHIHTKMQQEAKRHAEWNCFIGLWGVGVLHFLFLHSVDILWVKNPLFGVLAVVQWVKNPTAVAGVIAEVWV